MKHSFRSINSLMLMGFAIATLLLVSSSLSVTGWSQEIDGQEAAPPEDASGTLTIDDAQTSLIRNTFLASPLSGIVAQVDVAEGDLVDSGASLVRLRSELAEKELSAAEAALDAARVRSDNDVNLRYAGRTLEVREHEMRQSKLANEIFAGSVSQMEMEAVRLQVDQASLAIEQAKHELRIAAAGVVEKEAALAIARTKLDRHTVRAAVSGRVAEIDVDAGQWVEAGKPLVRIISLNPLRVECFVEARKHGTELIGRKVQFIPNGATAGEEFSGQVSFVSRELHPVTGQVRLWATIENPDDKLGPGTAGKLVIE